MICRSTRFGIGTGILVVVALAIAKPVLAGSWASAHTCAGHYGSCRSDIGCDTQPWGTSENVVPTVDTCYLGRQYGSCYTSGVVIRTLQYVPDGPDDPGPPASVMILEDAAVSAIAGDCYYNANGSETFTQNSLGPSNAANGHTTRKTWVDSSSGVITRKVYLAATAQVKQWSKAQVSVAFSGLSVLTGPYTGPLADPTAVEPPDRSSSQPYYPAPACSNPGVGGAAGHGDPVNLATGEHLYVPGADLSVYNPYGPAVSYQRNFFSKIAKEDKSSPGLPVGWLDGYDIRITSTNPADWSSLELTYPNSAKESPIAPVLAGGTPTGEFTEPAGSNHIVTGVPSATKGQWDSLTVTFKDRTKWRFSRTAPDTYMLSAIVNRMGRSINLVRDAQNRVLAVNDDQTNPVTLLSFTYPNGLLSQLTDVYGRKVRFTYEDVSGVTCLKTVSQISTSDAAPVAAEYGYELLGSPGEPHLTSVTIPSPKGSGNSTESFEYDSEVRVSALVDANGNRHEFSYECPDATRVKVKSPAGVVESEKLVIFDPAHDNVMTGTADADGANTPALTTTSISPICPRR